jgi:hypothetical protein
MVDDMENMENIKVNFEITGVNAARGVAYVKYWADGATIERFQSDIGPYEIPISPELNTVSQQELIDYVAKFGYVIVKRQKDAMDAEINGSANTLSSLVNQQINSNIGLE